MKNGNDDSPRAAALFEAANKLRGSVESAEYPAKAENPGFNEAGPEDPG